MLDFAPPVLFVLFAWWFSTGAILFADGLPRRTFPISLVIAGVVALLALYGLLISSRVASDAAAYLAFGCALAVWGWQEMAFLMGFVTGPRKDPCPPSARGWRRFGLATAAIIHHELALAATLAVIVALTWNQPNQVGTWTFLVLWAMRLSAKLNVFLGVRNLATEFIPQHLQYLQSYFRRARLNPLMPVSIVIASAVVVKFGGEATAPGAVPFVLVGRTLVATILALAVLEHLFLTLPMPDALLWRWALRSDPSRVAAAKAREASGEAP